MSHMALAVGENDSPSFLLTWREWTKAQCEPHHICKGGPSPTTMLPPLTLVTLILLKKKRNELGPELQVFKLAVTFPACRHTLFMHESVF